MALMVRPDEHLGLVSPIEREILGWKQMHELGELRKRLVSDVSLSSVQATFAHVGL